MLNISINEFNRILYESNLNVKFVNVRVAIEEGDCERDEEVVDWPDSSSADPVTTAESIRFNQKTVEK